MLLAVLINIAACVAIARAFYVRGVTEGREFPDYRPTFWRM